MPPSLAPVVPVWDTTTIQLPSAQMVDRLLLALRGPSARAYGLALLSTGFAATFWLLLGNRLAPSPFMLCLAAVAVTAWAGGLGPGLLLYVVPGTPAGFTPKQELLYLLVFLLVSLLLAGLQVARQQAQDTVAHQALHDSLTQLPNRHLYIDRLEQAITVAQRHQTACAVLLLDLDGFKAVNDTMGHGAGDLALQLLSRQLEASIRASDTLARWGGDEFALVLPESDAEGACHSAQRILHALTPPLVLRGTVHTISASIGAAVYPAHGQDGDALLQQADAAMYRCKRAGGGSYVLPDEGSGVAAPSGGLQEEDPSP